MQMCFHIVWREMNVEGQALCSPERTVLMAVFPVCGNGMKVDSGKKGKINPVLCALFFSLTFLEPNRGLIKEILKC